MMNLKKINSILLLVGLSLSVVAQNDPEAKEILDRASEKIKTYTSIQADFAFEIRNKADGQKSRSTGTIYILGDKYKIVSPGSQVFFDGVTMWTYMETDKEVTITQPDSTDDDFIENPAKIFSFYSRDFKYRLKGDVNIEGTWMYEIDLYPNNLNQPYSRYTLLIDKETEMISVVSAVSKDGFDYTATISKAKFDQNFPEAMFRFEIDKYPDVEVIDLRF